eukprot:1249949-Rhodomonas_salina.1
MHVLWSIGSGMSYVVQTEKKKKKGKERKGYEVLSGMTPPTGSRRLVRYQTRGGRRSTAPAAQSVTIYICLRACYAMPGTTRQVALYPPSGTKRGRLRYRLRACYAMSGTDVANVCTRSGSSGY